MKKEFEQGIWYIDKEEDLYPRRMQSLPGMPKGIFFKGHLPKETLPTIAIVGARDCSPYGRAKAFSYAQTFSDAGVQVISGMALGVDGESHLGALQGATPTYAVLGNGVDICYPSSHTALYHKILHSGGVLSEFPPQIKPRPAFFPARNRIISALADVVLVIEAKKQSGSFITVEFALEQGKTVYALPGSVDSKRSEGCHRLIAQGAGIAFSADMILEEMGILRAGSTVYATQREPLEKPLQKIYDSIGFEPKSIAQMLLEQNVTRDVLLSLLLTLELKGRIIEISKNYYVRKE
ncbi:MAG: DNA-processing protein DprA [Lachnospiraceae bacterium]